MYDMHVAILTQCMTFCFIYFSFRFLLLFVAVVVGAVRHLLVTVLGRCCALFYFYSSNSLSICSKCVARNKKNTATNQIYKSPPFCRSYVCIGSKVTAHDFSFFSFIAEASLQLHYIYSWCVVHWLMRGWNVHRQPQVIRMKQTHIQNRRRWMNSPWIKCHTNTSMLWLRCLPWWCLL